MQVQEISLDGTNMYKHSNTLAARLQSSQQPTRLVECITEALPVASLLDDGIRQIIYISDGILTSPDTGRRIRTQSTWGRRLKLSVWQIIMTSIIPAHCEVSQWIKELFIQRAASGLKHCCLNPKRMNNPEEASVPLTKVATDWSSQNSFHFASCYLELRTQKLGLLSSWS